MAVTWEPYLWREPVEASDEAFAAVERAWGVRLPGDYRAVARVRQGQTPSPGQFRAGGVTDIVSCLLHVMEGVPHASYSVLRAWRNLQMWAPAALYPFAVTPGGNYLCFDYRAAPDSPLVVYLDHEAGQEDCVVALAPSFSAFLDMLFDDG